MSDLAVQNASSPTPEGKTYDLAEILEALVQIVEQIDQKLDGLSKAHAELDREIHEDFFGPIHDQYKQHVRGQGIEGIKTKYGARFSELAEPLKAFGIDDVFARLYDALEELKSGEGYKDEDEGPFVDGIFNQAMERISKVRGKPAETSAEPPKEETPAVKETVVIGGEKPPESPSPKRPPKKQWSPAMDL